MSAGKGMAPRKGYNWAKYAENYDGIFRRKGTEQPEQPMKTPEQEQPTVLPWHWKAAKEIERNESSGGWNTVSELLEQTAAIIARHDPHAETLRLLEEALFHLEYSDLEDAGPAKKRIRAHLARLSKPTAHADGKKGSQ